MLLKEAKRTFLTPGNVWMILDILYHLLQYQWVCLPEVRPLCALIKVNIIVVSRESARGSDLEDSLPGHQTWKNFRYHQEHPFAPWIWSLGSIGPKLWILRPNSPNEALNPQPLIRVFGFFQKLDLEAYLLPRAGHIPQKPPKNFRFIWAVFWSGHAILYIQRNFQKMQRKIVL